MNVHGSLLNHRRRFMKVRNYRLLVKEGAMSSPLPICMNPIL